MKKLFPFSIAVSLAVFALLLFGSSKVHAQARPSHSSTTKVETYLVIKIIDENKTEDKIEYKAISTTQYKDEEKRVKEDNKTKIKEWHDQCKTDPQAPRPKTIYIKKVPKLSGYQTQRKAQEAADKLKADEAAKEKDTDNNSDEKPKDVKK